MMAFTILLHTFIFTRLSYLTFSILPPLANFNNSLNNKIQIVITACSPVIYYRMTLSFRFRIYHTAELPEKSPHNSLDR